MARAELFFLNLIVPVLLVGLAIFVLRTRRVRGEVARPGAGGGARGAVEHAPGQLLPRRHGGRGDPAVALVAVGWRAAAVYLLSAFALAVLWTTMRYMRIVPPLGRMTLVAGLVLMGVALLLDPDWRLLAPSTALPGPGGKWTDAPLFRFLGGGLGRQLSPAAAHGLDSDPANVPAFAQQPLSQPGGLLVAGPAAAAGSRAAGAAARSQPFAVAISGGAAHWWHGGDGNAKHGAAPPAQFTGDLSSGRARIIVGTAFFGLAWFGLWFATATSSGRLLLDRSGGLLVAALIATVVFLLARQLLGRLTRLLLLRLPALPEMPLQGVRWGEVLLDPQALGRLILADVQRHLGVDDAWLMLVGEGAGPVNVSCAAARATGRPCPTPASSKTAAPSSAF